MSANETYEKSIKDESPLVIELPNATAVAPVATPAVMPDAALIDNSALTEQSPDQLSVQPADCDKSKVPNSMSLFLAKPHEILFVNIAKPEPTGAGLYTIEPETFQHSGTQRYYQRPCLKPSTRYAFVFIKKLILIL